MTSVTFVACDRDNEENYENTTQTQEIVKKIRLYGTVLCYAWIIDENGNLKRVIVRCNCFYDTRTGMLYVDTHNYVELTVNGVQTDCEAFNPGDDGNPNKDKYSFVGKEDGICYASFTKDEMLRNFNSK